MARPNPLLRLTALVALLANAFVAAGAGPAIPSAATAPTLSDVRALMAQNRYPDADAAALTLLKSEESAHSARSTEVADVLGALVEIRVRRGQAGQPEVRKWGERALTIRERTAGPDDPKTASAVSSLGHVVRLAGDLPGSRVYYERALAIRERSLGPKSLDVATSLGDVAFVLEETGDFEQAKPMYERALAITEEVQGPNHPDVAAALVDLAGLLSDTGNYSAARPMLERALTIRETALGPTHPDVARSLNILAILYRNIGDYPAARQAFERALQLKEQALGPDHPDLARFLNNLASLEAESGDYASARPLFERAVALRTKALGPEHPDVGTSTLNLGNLLLQTGDEEAARSMIERAQAILEKAYGPDHLSVASCLDNLGTICAHQGDLAGARQRHERALAIKQTVLGPDHPSVAVSVDNLAAVALAERDLVQARTLYERALGIKEKSLGPQHPELARGIDNLAAVLYESGEFSRALALHQRALAIREQALAFSHPDVALSHRNCAFSELATGDTTRALASALAAEASGREELRLTTRSLGERQALAYAVQRHGGLDLALTLVGTSSVATDPPGTAAARTQVWDSLVRSRAVVLDEMGARHRGALTAGDATIDSLMTAVQNARLRLANLTVRGPGASSTEAYRTLLSDCTREKEAAERALATRSARFGADLAREQIGLREVLQALPPHAALLAYARFTPPPLPHAPGGASHGHPAPVDGSRPMYLAFVGRPAASTDPSQSLSVATISLGDAVAIDSLVAAWRDQAGTFDDAARASSAAEHACRQVGDALRARIWDPVVPLLVGAELTLVVPDGALHLMNFAALPVGDSGYLVEERLLHLLSAERDLIHLDEPAARGLLAVGDPDYDGREGGGAGALPAVVALLAPFRGARPGCAAFDQLQFTALPETRKEIAAVDKLWKRVHRDEASMALTGSSATEARLKAELPSKRVVHLATHGFFLGSDCPSKATSGSPRGAAGTDGTSREAGSAGSAGALTETTVENPLLLAGLALAGGNRREDVAPDAEDGVLTAEEVASLDLRGVEWAVLSACETATGDVRMGEGVFGLRRAFETAGTHTLIMSLWSVEDEAARAWMDQLYRARLLDRLSTAEAVRAADLRILADRRRHHRSTHPSQWAGFIAAGDWR